jgi:hypothetical protein
MPREVLGGLIRRVRFDDAAASILDPPEDAVKLVHRPAGA